MIKIALYFACRASGVTFSMVVSFRYLFLAFFLSFFCCVHDVTGDKYEQNSLPDQLPFLLTPLATILRPPFLQNLFNTRALSSPPFPTSTPFLSLVVVNVNWRNFITPHLILNGVKSWNNIVLLKVTHGFYS